MDEEINMDSIKKLLSAVNKIVKANEKIQEERRIRGDKFNIFDVVGLRSEEEKLHSAFLTELLNAEGNHGQKDAFLKAFIEKITEIGTNDFKTEGSKAISEYVIGPIDYVTNTGGRIDILVTSGDKSSSIIIENKINAEDQEKQLIRYNNFGRNKKYKNKFKLLYLTLDGHEASKDSAGEGTEKVNYIKISYREHIVKWLNRCLELSALKPIIRETIVQYLDIIKRLTNQDMDMEKEDELLNTLINENNINSAYEIIYQKSQLDKRFINDYFTPKMNEMVKSINEDKGYKDENELIFEFDRFPINDGGYHFHKKNWKLAIYVWKDNASSRFYIGITSKDENELINEINKDGKVNIFCHPKHDKFPYGDDYINTYEQWDLNMYKEIINGEYCKNIKKIIEQILNNIENNKIDMELSE